MDSGITCAAVRRLLLRHRMQLEGRAGAVIRALVNEVQVSIYSVPMARSFLLVVPPEKSIQLARLSFQGKDIDFTPILKLNQTAFISETPQPDEKELTKTIRKIANRTYLLVSNGVLPDNKTPPYHPFGWQQVGGVVIMYSNTPDNTLPMYHHRSSTWDPLFPRHSRI